MKRIDHTLMVSKYMTSVSLIEPTVDWFTNRAVRTRADSGVQPHTLGVKNATPCSIATVSYTHLTLPTNREV